MAQLPKRPCRGSCGALTDDRDGFCPACQRTRHRLQDRHRGSARTRGYDGTWDKLARIVKLEEPLCRICRAEGRITATEEIDHIIPFSGPDDPLRLDRENLQGLCGPHHRSKTRMENPR